MGRASSKPGGYFSHSRPELALEIEPSTDNKVLDVGCGDGALANLIRSDSPNCEIWGLEVDPGAATRAQENDALSRVLVGDIDELMDRLPRDYFTHIIAGDVLEHLVDPWSTLGNLSVRLQPGGRLVASIPNIRNFSFLARLLLQGSFRYTDQGVMDRTHLRFFARKDIFSMFEDAGLCDIRISPARPKKRLASRLAKVVFGDLATKVFKVTATRPS